MKKRKVRQILAMLLSMVLIMTTIVSPSATVFATTATNETRSITLDVKSKVTMYLGTSRKIKVKSVTPKRSSRKVTYESSDPSVVKVSGSGKMKALREGQATITVTSASNPEVYKEVKVTVKNLVKNKTYNKMVIALDKKPRTKKLSRASRVKTSYLKFSSSKKKVATVSAAGVVIGKKAGVTKITVKGRKSIVKGAKQVITLYVAKKSVETVALNKTSVTLKPEEKVKLATTVTPEEAANVVVYTTSDEKVAAVNQSGEVTALQEGTAEITATTVDGSKKAVCFVTVSNGLTEKATEAGGDKGSGEATTESSKTEATTEKNPGNTPEDKTEATTGENTGNTTEDKTETTTEKNTGNTTEDKTEATTEKNTGNTTEDKTEAPTDNKYIQPSIEREVVGSQIKVSYYTEKLPDCDDTSSFEMLQIDFTDGKEKDEIILGEDVLEVPYKTSINPYQIAKYETSYNTWYEVYQWAIKNGYTIANAGTEGGYGNVAPVGFTTNGEKPKFEKMPVCSLTWRDAMVWCNALNEMLGLEPVYFSDAEFTTPIRNSTGAKFTEFDKYELEPGGVDNPYVNKDSNGYRLLYNAEWEYAARKKLDGTFLSGRNAPGDDNGAAFAPSAVEKQNGIDFTVSSKKHDYVWDYDNSAQSGPTQTVDGLDDSNAAIGQSARRSHLSGGKKPSHLGVYDMGGNVPEWCFEYHTSYGSSLKYDTMRCMRGNDFSNDPEINYAARSGHYGGQLVGLASGGFRLARNLGESNYNETSDSSSSDNEQLPNEKVTVTPSTQSFANSNANFDMMQIDFVNAASDEIILGEDVLDIPYKTTVTPFQIGKYEISYNTWYEVYQWAIKNGYTIVNAGTEGAYGTAAGTTGFTTNGGAPKFKNMPVCGLTWRDAIVWCNALNEMLGLDPVYFSDAEFKTPIRNSTGAGGQDVNNYDLEPGEIDNPYVNKASNGYRLPYNAEWEYAARKKTDGTFLSGRNVSGDEDGAAFAPTYSEQQSGLNYTASTKKYEYVWNSVNSMQSGPSKTADGLDDTNAAIGGGGQRRTHLSGGKKPNHLGIYDMSGNVPEWCFEYQLTYGSTYKFYTMRCSRGIDCFNAADLTKAEQSGYYGGQLTGIPSGGFRLARNVR